MAQRQRREGMISALVAMMVLQVLPVMAESGAHLRWPLDLKPALSSTFGETRSTAFHAGIDLKTWGKTGHEVHAAEDGYVLRARTSPWGYGKALYVRLTDGRTAVYAHLDGFFEPVAEAVRSAQARSGRYSVQLWFEPGQIPVRRGQVIARTGQTGAGPPHLHFEVRDADNIPLNPLQHGAGPVADTTPPTLTRLLVTPLDASATVNGGREPVSVALGPDGDGGLRAVRPVHAWGPVGLAVDGYDRADLAPNRMAAFEHVLLVDGDTVWVSTYERVSYSDGHQVALDRLRPGDGGVYAALHRRPGSRLGFYRGVGDGVLWAGKMAEPAGDPAFAAERQQIAGAGGAVSESPVRWQAKASAPGEDTGRPADAAEVRVASLQGRATAPRLSGPPLAPGPHRVTVIAADLAGNRTTARLDLIAAAPPEILDARLARRGDGAWFVEVDLADADDERLDVQLTASESQIDAEVRTTVAAGGGPYTWILPAPPENEGQRAAWTLTVRDALGQTASQALAAMGAETPTPFDLDLTPVAGTRHVRVQVSSPQPLRSVPTVRALGRIHGARQVGDGSYETVIDLEGVDQQGVGVTAVAVAADGSLGTGRLGLSGRALRPGHADTLQVLDGAVLIARVGSAYEPLYPQATSLTPDASDGLRATPVGCDLGPADAAFDRWARLGLRVPAGEDARRLGVYADDGRGGWAHIGADSLFLGEGGDLYVSARVRALGRFALMADETPPTLTLQSPVEGEAAKRRPTLRARIIDAGSGITREEDIAVELDGVALIAVYDPEARLVTATPTKPLAPGAHRWTVRVRDTAGNEASASASFRVR